MRNILMWVVAAILAVWIVVAGEHIRGFAPPRFEVMAVITPLVAAAFTAVGFAGVAIYDAFRK